eukprot:6203507-Pleurochrysis_carterae.AAC.1
MNGAQRQMRTWVPSLSMTMREKRSVALSMAPASSSPHEMHVALVAAWRASIARYNSVLFAVSGLTSCVESATEQPGQPLNVTMPTRGCEQRSDSDQLREIQLRHLLAIRNGLGRWAWTYRLAIPGIELKLVHPILHKTAQIVEGGYD